MWQKFLIILNDRDLRRKFLYLFGLLAIFRLAASVPILGIDRELFQNYFQDNQLLGLLNIFSGGALDNLSIVMLGLSPYITASIIMQLFTMIFPGLKELYQEEGEAGRQKFNQYSRLLTVPLALVQGFGLLTLLSRQGVVQFGGFETIANLIIVTAGAVFLMWVGELITEYGIGNGASIMIFAGIIAGVPVSLQQAFVTFTPNQISTFAVFLIIALITIVAVVVISEGERPIPVYYAKRVRGMRMYGGVSTHLPLRVNQAGVIPIIFAISILLFPQMITNFFIDSANPVLRGVAGAVNAFLLNGLFYGFSYFFLVFLFTYFYTAVTFDPESIAKNLQRSGAFIPGIRPGPPTSAFLARIVTRITLVGGLFLGLIAVLPIVVRGATGITAFTLGGTALLIVVSVIIETAKQVEAQLSLRSYK
ncbi:preprotein translocase subunit SecY [Candidatus Giovannonibacteria bacterium RIFCSPHIGHO2_02_FULL_46_20]|uniref:Protein translocase subunit SecY n=1 Tax=Candidatus Giovannonibacteria bacterium RIFCSPHIGHO2_02_FULL_46_20 TaxID=1798338 RepID=A0A1F5WFJ3_9BACT|nr:MAG: preprotein translocase subunit SecY [Candidatus Giovannonibacteria bacterium RIFCSPHIGHO2_02_FULL_46_20]